MLLLVQLFLYTALRDNMTITYDKIATQTLSDNTTQTVTFSSISASYTDLILVLNGGMATTTGYGTSIRFNSDTGSNYSIVRLYGNGSSANSDKGNNQTYIYALAPGLDTLNSTHIVEIINYSNTTANKTCLIRSSNADSASGATVGLWRNTSAITSISLSPEFAANWKSGTTFTLYGILKA